MPGPGSNIQPPRSRRILSAQAFSKELNRHRTFRKAARDVLESHYSRSPASSAPSSSASSQLPDPQRRRSLDSSQLGPFLPPKLPHILSVFEDQKVFLHGSQMLEKLSRIIRSNVENFDDPAGSPSSNGDEEICSHRLSKQNVRRVMFYHDRLKQLLEERCIIILKGECSDHICRAQKFIEECKLYALKEKTRTVSVKLRNPFIDSTDININNLNQLMEKLSAHNDLWSSLMRNFRRVICLFHIGFSMHLHQLLCKTNVVLRRLRHRAFYWVHYILDISVLQLCQSDSNSISPELLQSILDSCKTFNRLLIEKSKHDSSHSHTTSSFCASLSDVIEIPHISCSCILNYLSRLEAGIAAEKIVRFLTSEGQKEMKNVNKNVAMKWIPEEFRQCHSQRDNSTSDYCSASASEIDNTVMNETFSKKIKIHVQPIDVAVSNMASLFGTIVQRNQALVLKYLFAVTCLNSSSSEQMEITVQQGANMHTNIALRPTWKVPLQRYTDKSCSFLEKVYWCSFWCQMEKYAVKLLTEASHHQYGDMFAGTVMLWPEVLMVAVMHILKQSNEGEDLSSEVQSVIQQIYSSLFRIAAYTSWNERFSAALATTESQRCPAVPVSGGQAGTKPGNLLCASMEPLIGCLLVTSANEEHMFTVKTLQQLICTLDYFYIWSDVRKRSLISSWDVSSYLLVSCSDTKHAINLLQHLHYLKSLKQPTKKKSSFEIHLWKFPHQKIDEMESSLQEVPSVVSQKAFKLSTEILKTYLSRSFLTSCCMKGVVAVRSTHVDELIDTILIPVFETLKCLPYQLSVVSSVVNAIADAWLVVLRTKKRKINVLDAQQFYQDIQQVLQWLEESELAKDDKKALKRGNSLLKLLHVAELLLTLNAQPTKCSGNNRIAPILTIDNYSLQQLSHGMTEAELEEWRRMHTNYVSSMHNCSGCF